MNTRKKVTSLELVQKRPLEIATVVEINPLDQLLADLSKAERTEVKTRTQSFLAHRESWKLHQMQAGLDLMKIKSILEPKNKWYAWVKLVPNIAVSQSYRLIDTGANAQRTLTPAVMKVALAGGYDIISSNRNESFKGLYATAARKIGAQPKEDEEAAKGWLEKLVEKRRELAKEKRGPTREASQTQLASGVIKAFCNALAKIPVDDRPSFAENAIGMIMTLSDVPKTRVHPTSIPKLIRAAIPENTAKALAAAA